MFGCVLTHFGHIITCLDMFQHVLTCFGKFSHVLRCSDVSFAGYHVFECVIKCF